MPSIRPVPPHEARPLRQALLYPDQSVDECTYPGDDRASTTHFGAFEEERLIGILSLFHQPPEEGSSMLEEADEDAWRIRGTAVREAWQGRGVGAQLVEAVRQHAERHEGRLLWCYARRKAVGFYERLGFARSREVQRPWTDRPFWIMELALRSSSERNG